MELIRIVRKSMLCIICALAAVISICIYQINSSNDAVTYRYYRQIIDDYDQISADRVGLTAEKLTAAYDTYREEDSEFINKAAELVENKAKYVMSYNSDYKNNTDNAGNSDNAGKSNNASKSDNAGNGVNENVNNNVNDNNKDVNNSNVNNRNYGKNTDTKSKNYNRIAESTLFGDENSFYILNANKQLKDKEKLKKADVAFNNTNTAAIEKLFNNRTMPLIYVLMMMVIIIHFTEENDNGVYVLVRTSRRGRIFLPVIRCFIIAAFNIILSCLFNSIIYGIYVKIYGVNGTCYIQNSKMFNMFPYAVSVNQIFVMYILVYACAMTVISFVIYFMINIVNNYKIAVTLMIAVLLCEYMLYSRMQYNSAFNSLKYINVFNVIFPGGSYFMYENWGRDGFITDICTTTWILTAVLLAVGLIGNVMAYSMKYTIRRKSIIENVINRLRQANQKLVSRMPLYGIEAYKMLIVQRGLLFILVGIYLFMSAKIMRGVDYSSNSKNYKLNSFYEEFDGHEADKEASDYIEALRNEALQVRDSEEAGSYEKGSASKLLTAVDIMQSEYEYVKNIKESRKTAAVIVNPYNYDDILGSRLFSNTETMNLIAVVIIILIAAGDYAFERQQGMLMHLRTAGKRKKLWWIKLLKIVILAVMIWGISTGINIYNITCRYSYNQIDKSILCLQKFADFPWDISICSYIILCYAYRLLWLIVIAVIAYMVSYRFSYKMSVIISLCILIPHVLYVLGVGLAKKVSIIAGMDINRMFATYGYGVKSVLLFIIVFMIMVIMLVCNYRKTAE